MCDQVGRVGVLLNKSPLPAKGTGHLPTTTTTTTTTTNVALFLFFFPGHQPYPKLILNMSLKHNTKFPYFEFLDTQLSLARTHVSP